jgi:DHA2 family multidrug resistance protein
MAMWGMGVMVGPILGPPLGGWLTDNYSWHWVFLINVPVGALCLFGVAASLPADDTRATRFDWRGFAFLAIGIGALQMMLDRGQLKDWFDAPEIRIEAALAFLGFYLYVVHWLSSSRPFVDLGLFRDRNFLASNIFIFIIGIVLFATMALLPPYLQTLMNYPVVTVGVLLAPRGIGTLIAMVIVGRLLARAADARIVAGVGMLITVYSMWMMTQWTSDVPQWDIIIAGIVQGVGVGLVFVPVSTVAYSTLPMVARTEAAGIYSLTRNIGSSVGISIMMALLARGTQINHAELASRLTPFDAAVLPHMSGLSMTASLEALNGEVTRQAATIAYLNDFWLMMILTLAAVPLLALLRPVKHTAPPDAAMVAE